MKFLKSELELTAWKKENLPYSSFCEVVFSGRSNVGKSSLINKLLNKKSLARTSSVPGKTVGINFYLIDSHIRFVDLPGYGYAKISNTEKLRISELVETYFKEERKLSLVVQIIDIRHKPSQNDIEMMDFLYNNKIPFIVVMSKSDKLKKLAFDKRLFETKEDLAEYKQVEKIPFSAATGEGIDKIRKSISFFISNSNQK